MRTQIRFGYRVEQSPPELWCLRAGAGPRRLGARRLRNTRRQASSVRAAGLHYTGFDHRRPYRRQTIPGCRQLGASFLRRSAHSLASGHRHRRVLRVRRRAAWRARPRVGAFPPRHFPNDHDVPGKSGRIGRASTQRPHGSGLGSLVEGKGSMARWWVGDNSTSFANSAGEEGALNSKQQIIQRRDEDGQSGHHLSLPRGAHTPAGSAPAADATLDHSRPPEQQSVAGTNPNGGAKSGSSNTSWSGTNSEATLPLRPQLPREVALLRRPGPPRVP